MERDSLDFKNMGVGKLFVKQFIPTLLGMISSALFIIVDGIFVGRGIGSDALAAVNIVAPLAMIATGLGLMFGMGGAIVASINLSRGKNKVANINFSQAVFALSTVFILLTTLILIFPYQTATLFGADAQLLEMAVEYLIWFTTFIFPLGLTVALPFFVRFNNPNYAMWCMLIATVINIVLDYIFIFTLQWGLIGAALATGIGETTGAILLLVYFFRKVSPVRFQKIKMSLKSIQLSIRNVGYMIKLGFSTFLSEITIAIMTLTGNYVFIRYMGIDGVAAFSIVCYLFPIVFMVFNATVQSAQPIISYNYGCGQVERSKGALKIAVTVAVGIGMSMFILFHFFSGGIVSLFISDIYSHTWLYASGGLPWFAIDFPFFGFNVVIIGYYTSMEKIRKAMSITILRGILPVCFFLFLPLWFPVFSIWLAVAIGDIITTIFIILLFIKDKKYRNERFIRTASERIQS